MSLDGPYGVHLPAAFLLAYGLGVLSFTACPAGWRNFLVRWGRSKVAAAVLAALAACLAQQAYSVAPPVISKLPVMRASAAAVGMSPREFMAMSRTWTSLFVPHEGAAVWAQVMRTAGELGFWRHTSGVARSAEQVAELANVTQHGARCVLEILALMGAIRKDPHTGLYSQEWSSTALRHLDTLAAMWVVVERPMGAHLTEAVRTGKAAGLSHLYGNRYRSLYHARTEVPELVAWTDFMDYSTKHTMAFVAFKAGNIYAGFSALLDVCGNEGTNAIMLAARFPQLRITVHDLPAVIEDPARGTRRRVREAGLEDRVSVFGKDLTDEEAQWPQERFDAVQLVHCVNEWSEAELRERLRQLRAVLVPGGILVVVGSFPFRTLASGVELQMPYFLTATQDGGSLHFVEDLQAAVQEAGFVEASVMAYDAQVQLVTARRPRSGGG